MNLWDAVSELKCEAFRVTHAESLMYLSQENVASIDEFKSKSNPARDFVKQRSRDLAKVCQELKTTLDIDRLIELKNSFSELLMFVKIGTDFPVERLPEKRKKTPDFRIEFRDQDLFAEVKALNVMGGRAKHREIMDEGLEKKIELWKQIEGGAGVALTWQVVQGHYRESRIYDQYSATLVTENLIEKVEQNISSEQFLRGPTFLLVDLCDQLLIHGSPSHNLEKEFGSPPQSGELWHAAFGVLNAPMRKISEFEGAGTVDQPLEREGILRKFRCIQGLVFHYRDQFWGAAFRRRKNILLTRLLEKLCTKVKFEPE